MSLTIFVYANQSQNVHINSFPETAEHILHWWGLTRVEGASPYGNGSNLEFFHGKILKFIASEMAGILEMLPRFNDDREILYTFSSVSMRTYINA